MYDWQMDLRMVKSNILTSGAIFMAMIALITFTACRSNEVGDQRFPKVSDPGILFTIEDLLHTPYKELNNYSTEGLPGATDVSFGFMKINGGDPYDYEMRFYESHQSAVNQGTAMAEEGTGDTAILSDDDANYKEGVKNRRTIIGGGTGGGARSGIGPKFATYSIFGNIVMLCQGSDLETSLERCGLMANELISNE